MIVTGKPVAQLSCEVPVSVENGVVFKHQRYPGNAVCTKCTASIPYNAINCPFLMFWKLSCMRVSSSD
jgi:hypothetical protein